MSRQNHPAIVLDARICARVGASDGEWVGVGRKSRPGAGPTPPPASVKSAYGSGCFSGGR